MPFSKCSQYPVVGRISANGIKNIYKLVCIFNTLFEMLTVPCGRSHFCKGY